MHPTFRKPKTRKTEPKSKASLGPKQPEYQNIHDLKGIPLQQELDENQLNIFDNTASTS